MPKLYDGICTMCRKAKPCYSLDMEYKLTDNAEAWDSICADCYTDWERDNEQIVVEWETRPEGNHK
jgi:hypothetical protein